MRVPQSISDLVPAPYNPRTITDAELGRLKSSIENFGDISGIVWNARTGHIVTGHQRLRSLKERYGDALEFVSQTTGAMIRTPDKAVFRIRVVDWDDVTERAANIAGNSPDIMGEFDDAKLDALVDEIKDEFDMSTIFADDESVKTVGEGMIFNMATPPQMVWCLIGLPARRFGEIAATVESVAKIDGIFCEVGYSCGGDTQNG